MPVGGRITVNNAAINALQETVDVRALTRMGEVGTQEAKRLCPVSPVGSSDHQSGQLRSSIGWHIVEGSKVRVGTDVDYALPVILGTAPHVIESHGDYPLRNRKGQVFGPIVHHPGTSPQDFLRPSLPTMAGAVT